MNPSDSVSGSGHDLGRDEVERLLDDCLAAPQPQWRDAIERVAAAHPQHADALRRRFAMLVRAGLVDATSPVAGRTFGGFELLAELGRGGMGVVYLARHLATARRVALKQIRPDLLGFAKARLRFRREVEIISRLDHPNICTVYDAGEVDGVPYVSMRFVDGQPLDRLLGGRGEGREGRDRESDGLGNRSTRQGLNTTLQVFEKIARALQAAHDAGVLHRDIKPGNLMLDADAEPIVLDFGLAAPADADGTGSLTASGDALGTPAYMSPEQISPKGRELDARSDVHSLAVTLYETVTGRHPFHGETREELYRNILQGRAPLAHKLQPRLPADLGAVLAMAMDVDRDRRYASAGAFADDLRRLQRLEPVRALRPGLFGRAWRWTRREPIAAALVVTFLVGALASTAFALSAERLRAAADTSRIAAEASEGTARRAGAEAKHEAERARREAETARHITEFLVGLFEVADRSAHRGRTITAREMLDQGWRRIDQQVGGEPEVAARLAATMALAYEHLGVFDRSGELWQRAETMERTAGVAARRLAVTVRRRAELRHFQDDYEGAAAGYLEALAMLRGDLGADADDAEIAATIDLLGRARRDQGRFDESSTLTEEALAMRRRLFGEHGAEIADSEQSRAMLECSRGDFEAGEAAYERALRLRREALGDEDPAVPELLHGLAIVRYQRGDKVAAERLCRDALALSEKLYGDDHVSVAHCVNMIGTLVADRGEYDEARSAYERARRIFAKVEGERSREVATAIHDLGTVEHDLRHEGESLRLLREALRMRIELFGPDDLSVASSQYVLGGTLADFGHPEEALAAYRESLRIRRNGLGEGARQTVLTRDAVQRLEAVLGGR